ncbi:MAG: caspase family protein [Syntrophales bacterium]|jgi:hypothetical protein|nr:caspase family protein [Syntrophales bacterium]
MSQLNVPMTNITSMPPSIGKQIPLKVAIQLPPEGTIFTKQYYDIPANVPSGRLLRKYATEMFPPLFAETQVIGGKPYPQDVAAVIIPTMENAAFVGKQVALGFGMKYDATVTLKVTMVTPDGMRIWSRIGSATATSRDVVSPYIPVEELVGEATTKATMEAFREMAREIGVAREVTAYAAGGGPQRQAAAAGSTAGKRGTTETAETAAALRAPSSTEKLPPARKDAHAVVIGIDYKNRTDIPNLNYAARDARKVYDVLTDLRYGGVPKENAILLLNEKATRNEMIAALRKVRTWDGYVYVFFSGHGAPKTQGDKFVDAFLIPSDVLISDPEALEETAIAVSYLQEILDKSKARGALLALDACFSGGGKSIIPKGGKPLVGMLAMPDLIKPAVSGKMVITSSAPNQQSWEDDSELKGGIFSHYLIEGLKGKGAKDQWVKADELAEYLKTMVPGAAYRLKRMEQKPQVFGSGSFSVSRNWDKAKVMDVDLARGKLKNTFEKGFISAEQLSKAMDDLKSPARSKLLDSFLDGKISDKQFGELY